MSKDKMMPPRDDLYKAVNNAIHALEEYLSMYNPLEIIANISHRIASFSLLDPAKQERMLWYPLIEYLMSLALAQPMPTSPKKTDNGTIEAVLDHWEQLKVNFTSYYGSEYVNKEGGPEAEIRFKMILDYFSVRGKAHPPHAEETFLGLFRPHKDHLVDNLGFSAEDFNDFIRYAETEITSALQQEIDALGAVMELQHRFSEWTKDLETPRESPEDLMSRFISENPDLKKQRDQMNQLPKIEAYDSFEIRPRNELHQNILNAISCSFGDNVAFLEPEKWRGWPTNDTIISERPVIRVEEEYYLLNFAMLGWNRIEILESLLKQVSPDYYEKRYLPRRDRYLEDTTIELLQKLLPDSSMYDNLYYYVEENGIRKRVELDGLALYDDCLLLIEAKAGMLPLPAKRGSIAGLKSKVSEILKEGHNQATRALAYIQSDSKAGFFDENDMLIVSVDGDRFRHQYLILVTLEPLFVLTSHLSSAKELGLLSGEKWPWAVYLNDLRVLADNIDHPSIFLHYLNRRIELNSHPAVETYDELAYFEYYLHTGLYFSHEELEQHDRIIIAPSTPELDAYYNEVSRNGVAETKPGVKMDSTFETLISRLETEMPVHFTSACFHLLNCDDETRSKISEQIKMCEEHFSIDKQKKSASFRIDGTGLLLCCVEDIDSRDVLVKNWATLWLDEMDVNHVTVLLWSPPIDSGSISGCEIY